MVDKDRLAFYIFPYLFLAMMFLAVLYYESRDIFYALGILLVLPLARVVARRALKYAEKLDSEGK